MRTHAIESDFYEKGVFRPSHDELGKGIDCSSSHNKGIVIDPLIKDAFLETRSRSPWVCVMMCHGNSHDVIVSVITLSPISIQENQL